MNPVTQVNEDSRDQPAEQELVAATAPDLRSRIRDSRWGTVLVLAVTTVVVMGAAYLVNSRGEDSGVRSVSLSGPRTGAPPEIGKLAQDFTATTVDGRKVSLSDYRGKAVWLTFGASWCAACQAEVTDIESTYQAFKDKDVVVLSVSISEDGATVRDYGDRVGLTFPTVADPQTRIASAYRVLGIPAHYFIDRNGVLRDMKTGSLSPEKMRDAVRAVS
jgi:cytochrome c biogenesis protein CcmG, thiol:disulfide interchange protein DsbE